MSLSSALVAALVACAPACSTGTRPDGDDGPGGDFELVSVGENLAPGWKMSWVVSARGSLEIGIPGCILNEDGSATVAGWSNGSGVFAPETDASIPIVDHGFVDIMLARIDAMGNPVWVRTVGDEALDQAVGIAAAPGDHFYVTGSVNYGPVFGAGEPNETELPKLGEGDVFLARYDLDGRLDWVVSAGGESMVTVGLAVAVLDDGNVVVVGNNRCKSFHSCDGGSIAFGHGTEEELVLESAGGVDGFVASYAPSGRLRWAVRGCVGDFQNWQGISGNSVTSIAADGDTFVVYGFFAGKATCSGTDDTESEIASGGGVVPYLARYDADGRLLWARGLGVEDAPYFNVGYAPTSMKNIVILENGDIAASGRYYGTMHVGLEGQFEPVTGSSPGGVVFLGRYDSQGTPLWVATVSGGSHQNHGAGDVAELDDGTIAMTGNFVAPAVFGKGEPGETRFDHHWGISNAFLALFRETGHLEWVIPQAGARLWGVAARENTIVATGTFRGTAYFGTGGLDTATLKSAGECDGVVMRLDRVDVPVTPR